MIDRILLAILLAVTVPSTRAALAAPDPAAEALLNEKRYQEAVTLLSPGESKADGPTLMLLGRAYLGLDQDERAAEVLEKAVQAMPSSAEAHYYLGSAYGEIARTGGMLKGMRYAGKVKSAFEKAAELDPRDTRSRQGLVSYHVMAPSIAGGDKKEAERRALEIKAIDPVAGLQALARVARATDRPSEAIAFLEEARAAVPPGAKTPSGTPLASAVASDLLSTLTDVGQVDRAAALAKELTADGDATLLYALGRFAAATGRDLDRGERALGEFLTLLTSTQKQEAAGAHWRLGMIRQHQGRTPDARQEYQTALKLNPDFKPAKEALAKL